MSASTFRPLFLHSAEQVLTLSGPPIPRRRGDLCKLGIIHNGAVLTSGEKLVAVGSTPRLRAHARRLKAEGINCRGRVVMPGFVDSHTHLVFAGSRVQDYEQRLHGKSYEQIAAADRKSV